MSGQHTSDSMHGIVAIEPLDHEPFQGLPCGDLVACNLRLDDRVNCRVDNLVWQANFRPTMVLPDERDALAFIHRKPFGRIGRLSGLYLFIFEIEGNGFEWVGIFPASRCSRPILWVVVRIQFSVYGLPPKYLRLIE